MWIRRYLTLTALSLFLMAGALPAAAQGAGPARTILVVGDSLSAEYGLQRGSGWVELLARRLQATGQDYQIHNSSISGDTTSGGIARLPGALERYKPEIVILELGSNDALRGLSLDMTKNNLLRMVDMAQQAGARTLLVGMQIPPNYGRKYAERFHALFAEVAAEQRSGLVPFLLQGMATDKSLFQSDGIHPNEQAQPRIEANVWKHLAPMLLAGH